MYTHHSTPITVLTYQIYHGKINVCIINEILMRYDYQRCISSIQVIIMVYLLDLLTQCIDIELLIQYRKNWYLEGLDILDNLLLVNRGSSPQSTTGWWFQPPRKTMKVMGNHHSISWMEHHQWMSVPEI